MKAAIWSFKLYSLSCSFPFDFQWDQEGTIQRTKSRTKRKIALLFAIMEWINMIFLLVTLVRNMKTYVKEQRILHVTFHSAWCAIIWVCNTNVYAVTFLEPYLIVIINETIRFSGKIKKLLGFESHSIFEKQKSLRERLLAVIGFYCVFSILITPFLLIYFRYQDWYLVNFLTPEEWKPVSWINVGPLVVAIWIELWYMVTLWGNWGVILYLHLIYLQTTGATLKLLRMNYPIRTDRNQIQQKMKIYTVLRIMNRVYNDAFKGYVWPMSLTLPCVIFIGGMCSLLREKSSNIIVIGFNGACVSISLGFLISSSIFMSKINTESEHLCHYFAGNGKETKVNRCLCASLKAIGIEVGSLYVVQKRSLFTLMGFLSNATVSALLSLNQIQS